jgi:hypothetical protein
MKLGGNYSRLPSITEKKSFIFYVLFFPLVSRVPRLLFLPLSPVPPSHRPSYVDSSSSMEVLGNEQTDEMERVEDGGAIPTGIGIDSSSQSASSLIPPPAGRVSSLLSHASLPLPSDGSGQGRRGASIGLDAVRQGAIGLGVASALGMDSSTPLSNA